MAKKIWISPFNNELKENTNTEQITWDSSSSEDECISNKKRRTLSHVNSKTSSIMTYKKNNLVLTDCQNVRVVSSTISVGSPIVGLKRLELYSLSPELTQRSKSIFVKEPSPIIEQRRVRLKKKKDKSKENILGHCPSPDLFDYEPTQQIISTVSQPIHSSILSEFSSQATIKIEPFPSQFSSQVKPADDIQIKNASMYYNPPKRRKNFKKGGLAHQLDKALKLKISRVQIWQHEKLNNIEGGFENEADIIRFKLKEIWKEYGNSLLLGKKINHSVSLSITNKKDMNQLDSSVSNDVVLLNIGSSPVISIEWKKENVYELFPPYNTDIVKYCGQNILYYSNASKFMKLRM